MTWLVVVASIVGYGFLAAGSYVPFARRQYRRSYQQSREQVEWRRRNAAREAAVLEGAWMAVALPLTLAYLLGVALASAANRVMVRPLNRVAFAPTDRAEARADQLRVDAAAWRAKAADPEVAENERAMAAELARLCDEQAEEITR